MGEPTRLLATTETGRWGERPTAPVLPL